MREATRELPLSRPWIDEREEELVLEVLRSGRLSLGPWIEQFEAEVAARVGAPYAAAVSSGTAGLHLLSHIENFSAGDEVITSPLSFVASANCFILEGAQPAFADVDPRTLNMDPAAVEAAITERTRAIVAVDMFGYPSELDALRAIADRHGLALIEDACEAIGAQYKGEPLGAHGPSAVFAFYPNKQMATGEGGVVVTHSEEVLQQIVSLRNQGRLYEGGGWFHHVRVGFNYRWTDVQAAIGLAQLEKLDRILELRAAAAERYGKLLERVEGVSLPAADDEFAKSASEFDTLEELRADLRTKLGEAKEQEAQAELRDLVLQELISRVDVELPERLVDEETEHRVEHAQERATRAGMTLQQVLEMQGWDELRFRSDARGHATRAIKADLILEAVARQEGLTVTAEELQQAVDDLAKGLARDPKEIRKALERSGQIRSLAGDIIRSKALDLLVEQSATVSQETGERDDTDREAETATERPAGDQGASA